MHFSCSSYIARACLFYSPRFENPGIIWGEVKIMTLLIAQFSSASYYFRLLSFKRFPQQPVPMQSVSRIKNQNAAIREGERFSFSG